MARSTPISHPIGAPPAPASAGADTGNGARAHSAPPDPSGGQPDPDLARRSFATVLRWSLVALFIVVGGAKLIGVPAAVALFDAVGFGSWFRYAVGATEVLGAALLSRTPTVLAGATVLSLLMVGAMGTEVLTLHRVPVSSLATLVALLLLARLFRSPA